MQAFHALMALPPTAPKPCPQNVPTDSGPALAEILDRYLDWCQKYRAARTYEWYRDHLQSFLDSLPDGLAVGGLKPFHVVEWADKRPDWSPTYRRGAIIAVQRPFN